MTGSSMANGISTSEALKAFAAAQISLRRDSRVCFQLARVDGWRWSYAAGRKVSGPTGSPPLRLLISEHWGLIIYGPEFLILPPPEVLSIVKKSFEDGCRERR